MKAVGILAGAVVGIAMVLLGAAGEIPGFSPNTGYWGSHFLDSTLYGMGNDRAAMVTVCILWGCYGAAGGLAAALLFGGRRRAHEGT